MRKREVQQRILTDHPASDGHPMIFAAQAWNYICPPGDPPNYGPSLLNSIRPARRLRQLTGDITLRYKADLNVLDPAGVRLDKPAVA